MSSTELVLLEDHDQWSRDAHRQARQTRSRRRLQVAAASSAAVFSVALAAASLLWNRPPAQADAQEIAPPISTTVPAATFPTPETIPPDTSPGWTSVRVQLPGWDDQGELLTDGVHAGRDNQVLPGSVGVAIVAIKADFTPFANAATAVVDGVQWRITRRDKVPQNDISSLFRRPVEPVLVLISMLPGTDRAYLEARR